MFEDSNRDNGILRSETYLTTNYEPENLIGRESEIDRIAEALKPLAQRRYPENLLVHGPAGAGKTTCVKHVFNQLEQEKSVKSVFINCWQYNTRPSLLAELLIQLGYPVPRKGKPVDELLSKLREWLDKNRGIAVALDEFDQLEDTGVVYDLQLLNQDADNSIGTVLISNKRPTALHIDQRSLSRLSMQTLQFQSYDTDQLTRILEQRVEQSFKPGTVPDETIEQIAEHVAANSGDCRKALEILLRAGREADAEGEKEISVEML